MANLVKVRDIFLYVGWSPKAADSYAAMTLLKEADVPFTLLHYPDTTALEPLNTWGWGPETSPVSKTFTDFPVLHWTELYDDWSKALEVADGLLEIQTVAGKLKAFAS